MKRTFVLGSGFSASVEIPTVRQIFGQIFKLDEDERFTQDFPYLKQAIHHLYPHLNLSNAAPSFPPFEEFLSLAYITQDFGERDTAPGQFSEDTWQLFYKSSLRLLTEVINSSERRVDFAADSPLKSFAECLAPSDTVVTFNWDCLLEKQLTRLGVPFALVPNESDGLLLLKLHGSLSWANLDYEVKPRDEGQFFVLEDDPEERNRLLCTTDFGYADTWLGIDQPPFIVTPIAHKRPLEKDVMRRIWYEAFSSLADSDTIAVIGYSLPPEDYHSRSLLVSGVRASNVVNGDKTRVVFLNPDVHSASRFYTQVTSRFDYLQKYFTGNEFPHGQ